jgi:hypothetical protein
MKLPPKSRTQQNWKLLSSASGRVTLHMSEGNVKRHSTEMDRPPCATGFVHTGKLSEQLSYRAAKVAERGIQTCSQARATSLCIVPPQTSAWPAVKLNNCNSLQAMSMLLPTWLICCFVMDGGYTCDRHVVAINQASSRLKYHCQHLSDMHTLHMQKNTRHSTRCIREGL